MASQGMTLRRSLYRSSTILVSIWIKNYSWRKKDPFAKDYLVGGDEELRDRLVLCLAVDEHLVVVVPTFEDLVQQGHVPDVFQQTWKTRS